MMVVWKRIFVLSVGNILEFYDFAIYGLLVGTISPLFFPSDDTLVSLLNGFGVFAIGFLSRPIGAIYFGKIGDTYGRARSLSLSLIIMSLSTVLIGFLPTYESIGVLAPVCLLILRVIQGFCLGGEFSGSLILLVEKTPTVKWRALWISIVTGAGVSGWFLGAGICYVCLHVFSHVDSWRLPFMLSALTGFVGYYIRIATLNDKLRAPSDGNTVDIKSISVLRLIADYPKNFVAAVGIGAFMGCMFYGLFIFPNSFLPEFMKISHSKVMMVTTLGIGAYMILLPLMGWVADKIGHVSLMKKISMAALPLGFLMFYFLNTKRFDLFVYVEIIAAFILAAFMAPATFVMTKLFPIQVRYTGTSLGYNIGACVFGGIAPFIFTSLIKKTESLIFPAFYLSVCVALGILSAYLYQQISSINLSPRRG